MGRAGRNWRGTARSPSVCAHERGGQWPIRRGAGCALTTGDNRPGLGEGGHAGQGPQPALDLLSSSGDEPRAEDRLRNALERSGALGWTRRHRPLLGGLAAVLIVVAAGTAYVVTRPPPLDPVVNVSVADFRSGTSNDYDARGRSRVEMTYQLTADVAGDVDTALGVVGPGLTKPTSSISKVRFRLPRTGALGATVDCSDSQWWAAKGADYRVRARRTDTYGRVTTYDAPLGHTAALWHIEVRRICLRTFFEALPPPAVGSASTLPGQHKVKVTFTLTNPSRHAVWVKAPDFPDETMTAEGGPWTLLPAGGSASVSTTIGATDCTNGRPRLPFARSPEGVPRKDRALPVLVSNTRIPDDRWFSGGWARFDPASVIRVDRKLDALCPRSQWRLSVR
jgi:hypothetical protein